MLRQLAGALRRQTLRLLPHRWQEIFLFIEKLRYVPNFSRPKTFNEKIYYRKRNWQNNLFIQCADKVRVKEYVAALCGPDIIIETYHVGDSIAVEIVKELIEAKGGIVIKTNHDSGGVAFLDQGSTDEEVTLAVAAITGRLGKDFGGAKAEGWYSRIEPKILVERRLYPTLNDQELLDYKFHVFTREDAEEPFIVLQIDFGRFTNHTRSFFDQDLHFLPFANEYPAIVTRIPRPGCYDEMLAVAKKLARAFSYVRVDFYSQGNEFYFGELTFAHGSGRDRFHDRMYDLWMGRLWQGDPRF